MLLGLLAGLPRANCWTIAEHAGQPSPYALHHLLSRAVWDHDEVREDLRGYVVAHLGCPDAVLVVDLCRHCDYAEGRPRRSSWSGLRSVPSRHSYKPSRKASVLSGGR
jgi:SRSO17 transposase